MRSRIFCILVTVLVIAALLGVGVVAFAQQTEQVSKDGLTVSLRTDKDMSFKSIIIVFVACVLLVAILPVFPVGIAGALMTAVFGFLFVSIASRIVGVVGSSSNPISGMTIATIFFSAIIFKAMGNEGTEGMVAADGERKVTIFHRLFHSLLKIAAGSDGTAEIFHGRVKVLVCIFRHIDRRNAADTQPAALRKLFYTGFAEAVKSLLCAGIIAAVPQRYTNQSDVHSSYLTIHENTNLSPIIAYL